MNTRDLGYDTPPDMKPEEVWEHKLSRLGHMNRSDRGNKTILIVGGGVAGLSAALALLKEGFRVTLMQQSDTMSRAHSVSAQGGINSNLKVDHGDTDERYSIDTRKGGDYLMPKWWVDRFVSLSGTVIDELANIGTPFSVNLDGLLAARSFGGVKGIERTSYVAGETGKHIVKALYYGVLSFAKSGQLTQLPNSFVLDLIMHNGRAQGVVSLNINTGKITPVYANAVIVATGGYGSMYYRSTNADDSGGYMLSMLLKHGARFTNPSMIQFHPTTMYFSTAVQQLISEASRNHGRFWVPRDKADRDKDPRSIPLEDMWHFIEEEFPVSGNLIPRDIASQKLAKIISDGYGVGPGNHAVYLDMRDAVEKHGRKYIMDLYGTILQTYQDLSGFDPCEYPMVVAPTAHFTMGGLEVDYLLQSNIPGLFGVGEVVGSSVHGANRLGANSLQQAVQHGLCLASPAIQNYFVHLQTKEQGNISENGQRMVQYWQEKLRTFTGRKGGESVLHMREELGDMLYKYVGVSRSGDGLLEGIMALEDLAARLPDLSIHQELAGNTVLLKALMLHGHMSLARLTMLDALWRRESRGAHVRTDFPDRDDKNFLCMSSWSLESDKAGPVERTLDYKPDELEQRSY